MKKTIVLFVALAMIICLAACGAPAAAPATAAEPAPAEAAPAEADATVAEAAFEPMELQLGHCNPTTDVDQYHKFATLFAEKISAATDGAVTIQIFGNNELGTEKDVLDNLSLGTQQISIISNVTHAAIHPMNNVLELPFQFKDKQTVYDFLDTDVWQKVCDSEYEEVNVKILGWAEGGFRNIFSQKPLNTAADLAGMKIRVPESPLFMDTFKALGANPTPMNNSEMFSAVQQGVIDGLEQPTASGYTGSFWEVCKYYNMTGHFYNAISISASRDFWESLSPELQEIFETCAVEAGAEQRVWLSDIEEGMLEDMNNNGCTIVRDIDTESFQTLCQSVYEQYRPIIGEEIYDEAMAALGR